MNASLREHGTTPGPLPWMAAGVTVLLWSSAFVGIRFVADGFTAGGLTLVRTATASVVLTVAVLARAAVTRRRIPLPRGRTLLAVVAWGVGWFGVYNLALNTAEQHLDAGTTALVVNLAPVIVVMLAGVFLNEGFPPRLLLSVGIALAVVITIAAGQGIDGATPVGVALALVAAGVYGLCATAQKSLGRTVDPLTMTWLGCLLGVATSLPFAGQLAAAPPSFEAVAVAAYLGVFPTAVAFLTWCYALSRLPAGRLATSTYASPALAVLLAWLLLAEPPGPSSLLGGALCLLGVAAATIRRPGLRRIGRAPRPAPETRGHGPEVSPPGPGSAPTLGDRVLRRRDRTVDRAGEARADVPREELQAEVRPLPRRPVRDVDDEPAEPAGVLAEALDPGDDVLHGADDGPSRLDPLLGDAGPGHVVLDEAPSARRRKGRRTALVALQREKTSFLHRWPFGPDPSGRARR